MTTLALSLCTLISSTLSIQAQEKSPATKPAPATAQSDEATFGVQLRESTDKARILARLDDQAVAWNAGDIDRFMETYWKSEQLTFSSGGSTTRGWQATRDRYKAKYDTRAKMGTLKFDQLEVMPLAPDAALVLGRWHLKREPLDIGGNFSLIMRRIEGDWVIVHDHTSSDAK